MIGVEIPEFDFDWPDGFDKPMTYEDFRKFTETQLREDEKAYNRKIDTLLITGVWP